MSLAYALDGCSPIGVTPDHRRKVGARQERLEEKTFDPGPAAREIRIVQLEGARHVEADVAHYNINFSIRVGCRVKSPRTRLAAANGHSADHGPRQLDSDTMEFVVTLPARKSKSVIPHGEAELVKVLVSSLCCMVHLS